MIQKLKRLSPFHEPDQVQLEKKIREHKFIKKNNLKLEK